MNDSSYTILIPALLLLSAALVGMLYARFAFRSRENSEEIDLVDIELAESSISAAASVDDRSKADDTERVPFLDPRSGIAPVLEVATADAKEVSESENDEAEYFDELQEAAAGLAALMRSSPVGRSTPVVYAPDDLDDEAEDGVDTLDDVVLADEPQEILMPASELVSADSNTVEQVVDTELNEEVDLLGDNLTAPVPPEETEVALPEVNAIEPESVAIVENDESEIVTAVIEDPLAETTELLNAVIDDVVVADAAIENSSVPESVEKIDSSEPENEVLSIRALLGDDVTDQFDSLDEGLNDLENLVISIESALSSLNDGFERVVSDEESEAVSEAA